MNIFIMLPVTIIAGYIAVLAVIEAYFIFAAVIIGGYQ